MEFKLSSLLKIFGKRSPEESFDTWLSDVGNSAERRLSHAIIPREEGASSKPDHIQAYADNLHNKGVIKNAEVHHANAETLVKQYSLHTDIITKETIETAKGGILHIKSFCDIYENHDFGFEVIQAVTNHISSNPHSDPVIVLSDTPDNIQKFLERNPKLGKLFEVQTGNIIKQHEQSIVRRQNLSS